MDTARFSRILVPIVTLLFLVITPLSVYAQDDDGDGGGGDGAPTTGIDTGFRDQACEGVTGASGDCSNSTAVTNLVANVLNILSFVVGAGAVIMIVIGGFRYVTSNGDPQGAAAARNTIIYAIVGLIVALAAQGIVQFVLDGV